MNLFYLRHRACGKPAIYLTERPTSRDPVSSTIMRHADGSRVKPGAPAICESCGTNVCQPCSTSDIYAVSDEPVPPWLRGGSPAVGQAPPPGTPVVPVPPPNGPKPHAMPESTYRALQRGNRPNR